MTEEEKKAFNESVIFGGLIGLAIGLPLLWYIDKYYPVWFAKVVDKILK